MDDPLYRTPASHNIIYQNLWSIVLGAPMLLLMGVAARSVTMGWVCFGICIALLAFILVLQFRETLFHKKETT